MITGGGTGGHTSPAVAIFEEIQSRDPQLSVQWVGCKNSVEERVAKAYSIPFRAVPSEGWPRENRLRRIIFLIKLIFGALRSFVLLLKFRPQVVLGVGGYVSVPLTWAAQRMGIPTVLHEQNKRLGMANRVLAKKCDRLLLSFEGTVGDYPKDNASVVGNPVRSGFSRPPNRDDACEKLGLDASIPVILICGGSQGARRLNEAMEELLQKFSAEEAQFIWMTGPTAAQAARSLADDSPASVSVYGYIDDMVSACAASTLIVSRAGASSTAEICVLGKPSILVPYPYATDNHQEQNARALEEAGGAVVLLDEACTGERLAHEIRTLLENPKKLDDLGENALRIAPKSAVEEIVEVMFSVGLGG